MENYKCQDVRFADIQMLRYRLDGFDKLSLNSKKLIYCLSEATLWGRDITFDQFGKYNLKIRKTLEAVFLSYKGNRQDKEFLALTEYLNRVWFSNGIYHHYGCEKFVPDFSEQFLRNAVENCNKELLPLGKGETAEQLIDELSKPVFDPSFMPKRVNMDEGVDVVKESACNFYDGVTQKDVEDFYKKQSANDDDEPVSHGLNTTLVKSDGALTEHVWKIGGLYGAAIEHIVFWLNKAKEYAQNDKQRQYIETLVDYYTTGDLKTFNKYCIEWVQEHSSDIDFVNGFIEVYGDPLGLKGSWEGIVEYKDMEATKRTKTISDNAQWFEDHSPVDPRFRKEKVKGVTAHVVRAAMLGGDEYPSTAIGINLPNADWIRARYGSKSVTISNLIGAYNEAAHGNGFKEEFIEDKSTVGFIDKYGDICDDLHTDLHECLGHGSGRLLDGVSPDALKTYGSTIEEARADLFGLYYIADKKLIELGLLDNEEAYKASYYTYIMNGLMTQLVRIAQGNRIEEAHMRNRALIAHWVYEHGRKDNVVEMYNHGGKTFIRINDYGMLRELFARLLAEVQRIKSEGDYDAARHLVETYGVNVDKTLHEEVLQRYSRLNLAPYKGFINPVLKLEKDNAGNITDITADYTEGYAEQMLRYSTDYAALI
ncbi:dihydrofolate reductase [uncultured Prevotella sp.]|uniref:dipeptidyl-peptidase 3 family protein n=1 Tax=uncultured Prevotella sp. TaxID=159272 RepID=UPI00262D1E54|nr:dihydrofolate reductase [uncultured Prevotella sp.]